jgi:2-deoxy-D-gluconate 3-dehydrogenase
MPSRLELARDTQARVEAAGVRSGTYELDVLDIQNIPGTIQRVLDDLGRLDILINNAGTTVRKSPEEITAAEWDTVLDVNLRAAFLSSRAVYPHFKARGGGKIICIGSMFSIFGGGGSGAPYASSKGGVVQLAKSFAVAWAPDNIQSNVILPGWFMTELTQAIPETQPERYDNINRRIPMGRWGEAAELQGATVFLSSRASDYVTGAVITVDGGYSVA